MKLFNYYIWNNWIFWLCLAAMNAFFLTGNLVLGDLFGASISLLGLIAGLFATNGCFYRGDYWK